MSVKASHHWDLVQQAICVRSSDQSWNCRLVRNCGKVVVQVIFPHYYIPVVCSSQNCRKKIEQLDSLNSQACLLSSPDWSRHTLPKHSSRCTPSTCPTVDCEGYIIPRHQSLGDFPDKYHPIPRGQRNRGQKKRNRNTNNSKFLFVSHSRIRIIRKHSSYSAEPNTNYSVS